MPMEGSCYIIDEVAEHLVAGSGIPRQVVGGRQMNWGRVLVPLLALVSSCACLAQDNRSASDPTLRTSIQAMRDGRFTDAEKIVTDAVHELEQNDPQNPRLATYLKRLA